MRRLGFVCGGFLALAACAKDPDYGTGTGGNGGNGGTGGGGGGAGGSAGSYVPPALKLAHPNPIISRGAQVFSLPAGGAAVVNGTYHNGGWNAGSPTSAAPAWVAIKLTAGPTRVLVSWDDGGTYDYKDPAGTPVYGLAADYHFEVSSDSTNGMDGTWAAAGAPVTGNHVRTRAHALDFTGKSWIKMVITAAPAEASNGVQIGEIDVHDISATGAGLPDDTWFFMGDSITAFAYDRTNPPSFATLIDTATAHTYFPAMINGGIGGELTSSGLARLDEALALNPDYHFFAITYGTNDSWGNKTDTSAFRTNLQMMIDKIKAAGRTPVLSHVPYSDDRAHDTLAPFDAVVDDLTRTNQLQVGPDFTAYFMQHTDQLQDDKVHPAPAGRQAMNQLWADAMRVVYP
jgi:lysophospholipase L1-like esterase